MNLHSLVTDLKSDEQCWQATREAHTNLLALRQERQRLERMCEEARVHERDAMDRVLLLLTAIKNRLEGSSG